MNVSTKCVKIKELNHLITCVLCGGYYVDATTIVECLHSFCKSCIVRYLEASKFCPVCDVQVHNARPLLSIRPDQTLQGLVYKLVPGLFTKEIRRRREFYTRNPVAGTLESAGSSDASSLEQEKVSVVLQFSPDGQLPKGGRGGQHEHEQDLPGTRFLLCPVVFTVAMIKKFLRVKFDLTPSHEIDIFHADGQLSDKHTMMEVAYMCAWNRTIPVTLHYCVYTAGAPPIEHVSVTESAEPRDSVIAIASSKSSCSAPHRSSAPDEPPDIKPPKLIINFRDREASLSVPGVSSLQNQRHVINIQPIKEETDSGEEVRDMTYVRRSIPVSIPLKRTIDLIAEEDDDGDRNYNSPIAVHTEKRTQTIFGDRNVSKLSKLRKRICKHHEKTSFSTTGLCDSSSDDFESPQAADHSSFGNIV